MSAHRALLSTAASVAALALTAGCSIDAPRPDSSQTAGSGTTGVTSLPIADLSLDPAARAWATGKEIHLDKRTVRAERHVTQFVVGPHGVYYAAGGDLWFSDLDSSQRIGRLGYTSLTTSADGRLLGFLDFTTTPATGAAFDLETGDRLVRDASGMGDPDEDLPDLYEDAEPQFLGFDADAAAYTVGADHAVYRLPLDGSGATRFRKDVGSGKNLPVLPPQGQGSQLRVLPRSEQPEGDDYVGGEVSPGGAFVMLDAENNRFRPASMKTGEALALDLGRGRSRFTLGSWLDDHRVLGAATLSPAASVGRQAVLVECDLSALACHDLSETFALGAHQSVLFEGRRSLF